MPGGPRSASLFVGTLLVVRRGVGESAAAIGSLSRRGRASLVLASCMGLTLNVAMFSAFGLIPIALALMLFYTYPAGVVVVDVAMGHERITASRLVALGLSTLGVVLVLVGGLDPAAGVPVAPLGVVLGLAAAAAQVVFVTISRHGYRSVPADGATLVNLSVSLVGGVVIALVVGQGDGLAAPLRSLDPWPVLLLAGIVAAGMSSLLFLTAIRLIGGTRTGILMLLEPVVGRRPGGVVAGRGAGAGPGGRRGPRAAGRARPPGPQPSGPRRGCGAGGRPGRLGADRAGGRAASHSSRVIAYSTSPSSSPGIRSGHSPKNSRTKRIPAFSITRHDPSLTFIVEAWTRRAPCRSNAASISAREPSVARPRPQAARVSR